MKPECPRCHADIARRINPLGLVERVLACFSVHYFRCQLCAHRYRRMTIGPDRRRPIPDKRQLDRLPTRVHAPPGGGKPQSEDAITHASMGQSTYGTASRLTKAAFPGLGLSPFQHEPSIL